MTAMKIKALAPWFGGKRTLAPRIVAELGKHSQFFDPMCGSMAVLFAKEPSRQETVNDLHGSVTNLARVIKDPHLAPDLYSRLQRTVVSEGLLNDAGDFLEGGMLENQADAEHAYWYFLASWVSRNGTAGMDRQNFQIAVRWTANGGSPAVRFRSTVESLPAWHRRLQNVVILNRDAFEIIPPDSRIVRIQRFMLIRPTRVSHGHTVVICTISTNPTLLHRACSGQTASGRRMRCWPNFSVVLIRPASSLAVTTASESGNYTRTGRLSTAR